MSGPLAGLRVLELGHFVAAPFCTRLLGDLGADVVKVEPLAGDPVRDWGEQVNGRSLWWSIHGRNKRCITLNLKHPDARDIVHDLAARSDVVVENFRPGHLGKLGLGDDDLKRTNPRLVIAHISGYGQSGPYKDRAAFGVIGEAMSGLRYLTNHPPALSSLPPVRVGVSIGDSIAGLYAAFGIMAAVWRRDWPDGEGKAASLDVALTESVLSMMEGLIPEYGALGKVREPSGSGLPTAAPSNAYRSADGEWILIGANSEPLFARLCRLMDRGDLLADSRYGSNRARVQNAAELDAAISAWTVTQPAEALVQTLMGADIPATKVFTAADCANDPQFRKRGMVREIDDTAFGPTVQQVLHTGIVPHFPDGPGDIRWPGPAIGVHTDEVLGEIGRSASEIARLRQEGAC